MTQRAAELQTIPFVVLCGILSDRSAAMLSAPWDRDHTETLARRVAALFAPQRPPANLTIAALGWAYPAGQLTPPNPLSLLFAWHAVRLVRQTRLSPGGPLATPLPVMPHPRLPLAPPAVQAEEKGSVLHAPRLHVVGIPCALIGRSRTLIPLIRALTPLPAAHPALTTLRDLMRLQFATPAEAVWPVAPVALQEMQPRIQRVQHEARRWRAIQYAREHAPTSGGPLVAAQARYGTSDAIQLLSLIIQRVDTLETVTTYLFSRDDFTNGLIEAQRFIDHLCFVWGVRFRHTHPSVFPVRRDPHGQLHIFRLCPDNTSLFPADTRCLDWAH